jgi:hypothetical protein
MMMPVKSLILAPLRFRLSTFLGMFANHSSIIWKTQRAELRWIGRIKQIILVLITFPLLESDLFRSLFIRVESYTVGIRKSP